MSNQPPTDNELAAIRIALARHMHNAPWSGWTRYMLGLCTLETTLNGATVTAIPVDKVERWTRQMNTPFDELPENERKSDYVEADAVLALPEIKALLAEVERLRDIERKAIEQSETVQRDWLSPMEATELKAEVERLRANVKRMQYAGGILSNIAYNLKQSDLPFGSLTRTSLDTAQKAWDAAVK